MADYLKDLNDVQLDAVTKTEGPSLIIAGAGSGKTRVLTYRIAHLLNNGVNPRSILSLTFTNKAAKEMKERIGHLVGESLAKQLWMGTFHSIFARILRNESQFLGYPSTFTIYDSQDSKNLVRQIIKNMQLDDTVYKPGDVFSRISYAKNNLITPQAYAANPRALETDRAAKRPQTCEIYREYVVQCYKSGTMDFDDLLLNTNILFRDFADVLQKYQSMFQYILVDEYQDTNFAQYLIVKKLAQRHNNVCVVGDDAQSIYSFRGAKIENILNFRNDYPGYNLFKLEQNYRSTQTIVNAANSLIGKNKKQIQKRVFSENAQGDLIKVLKVTTDIEEGYIVANNIVDIRMSEQRKYNDFAILYRTNAQSRIFEESLRKRNIPYKVYGGLSFYQRKEIKDMLSYLRLIVNPKDDEAFRRIINYPARGIGDTTLSRLEEIAKQRDIPLFEVAINLPMMQTDINKGTQAKINQFITFIAQYSRQFRSMDAYELTYQVATGSGILNDLKKEKTPEAVSKFENLEELLNSIKEFTEQKDVEGTLTLEHYLENVALLTDADNDKGEDTDRVTIMTIHSSKGLEFSVVFIVGMEEELFPSRMASTSLEDIEEERRLFYVAITRAKEKCFLSHVGSRYRWGNATICSPSRFLNEIDEEFMDLPEERPNFAAPGFESTDESPNWERKPKFATPTAPPAPKPSFAQQGKLMRMKQAEKRQAAPPTTGSFEADDPSKIKQGMKVAHERFGFGIVAAIEGDGNNAKATVQFTESGEKQLLLKFARLKIVG